jgi:hypothetical protein
MPYVNTAATPKEIRKDSSVAVIIHLPVRRSNVSEKHGKKEVRRLRRVDYAQHIDLELLLILPTVA